MRVNSAIILCAGMGNRMGAYGNFLPKPLWPFFQTSLLGLQVHYLKSLGIKNIFINLHHQKDLIQKYIESTFPEIKILIEEEILDVGGGIQNFLNQEGVRDEAVVMAVNSDIFINISAETVEEASSILVKEKANASLFLRSVQRLDNEGYTEVVTNELGEITSLIKSKEVENKRYNTYVGCCLINNSILPKVPGVSRFFQSIANFNESKILGHEVKDYFYDLGTLRRYQAITSRLWCEKEESNDELIQFLRDNQIFT